MYSDTVHCVIDNLSLVYRQWSPSLGHSSCSDTSPTGHCPAVCGPAHHCSHCEQEGQQAQGTHTLHAFTLCMLYCCMYMYVQCTCNCVNIGYTAYMVMYAV